MKKLSTSLSAFINGALKEGENTFSTIIDCSNSDRLRDAMKIKRFIPALKRSRCVIFYHCHPITKSEIAIALRNDNNVVLGVGDGANDSLLLRSSDVGIGIIGHDGSRNFDGCDFSVPSFRHICRLILIHGHYSYHRSILTIHFSFYKAALFAFCQAIYQIWTGFSAHTFFDSFSSSTYNLLWTFIPMLSILFDKDISENFFASKKSPL